MTTPVPVSRDAAAIAATRLDGRTAEALVSRLRPLRPALEVSLMSEILVVYYSRNGSTAELASQVCRGVESVAGRELEAADGSDRERRE